MDVASSDDAAPVDPCRDAARDASSAEQATELEIVTQSLVPSLGGVHTGRVLYVVSFFKATCVTPSVNQAFV